TARFSLLFLLVLFAAPALATPIPGWLREDIPATGSYLWRYLPVSADPSSPLPVILFLHGAGTTPDQYENFVRDAAEAARRVFVPPTSSSNEGGGLGPAARPGPEAPRLARRELRVAARRVAIAGHSAGGPYASLLAYPTVSKSSAVFPLPAPDSPVSA